MSAFLRVLSRCPEVIYGYYTIVPFKLDFVAKKGGMAVPFVWRLVCPLAAYPSEPRRADCSTHAETRCASLLKSKSKRLLILAGYTTIHGEFFRRAEKIRSAGMQITICDPSFSFSFRGILRCVGLEPSELGFARRFRCHRPQVRPLCVDCS